MTNATDLDGWRRLGGAVRQARIRLGFTCREIFAEVSGVSVRVLSDLESGARSNFSGRVLARVEATLRWPAGTADQIIDDADFVPPDREVGDDLLFRPPVYDRRPVRVDVNAVEHAIASLAEVSHGTVRGVPVSAAGLSGAIIALCWPYVLRVAEDNCHPGEALNPAVRPLYDTCMALAREFTPVGPPRRYAQWLVGEGSADLSEAERQKFTARWQKSRRTPRGPFPGTTADDD